MANYAVPAPDDGPTTSYAVPAPDDIQPSSPQRAMNVQSNDVGAARYGTLSGTSPKSIPQPSMNRYNRMVNAALIPVATALPSLYSHTGLPGSQAAGNLSSNLNQYGNELVNGDSQAMGLPSGQQGPSLHGFGEAAQAAGSMIPATALGAASGLNSLAGGLAKYIPEGVSYLGNIASAAAKGGLGGSLYGALNSLITPTPEGQNYAQHLAPNLAAGAEMGAVIPGGLSAIEGAPSAAQSAGSAIKSGTSDLFKKAAGTSNVALPPEVMNGESVHGIMADPKLEGMTIADLQRVAQGTGPEAAEAKSVIQRLTVASGAEHNIDLSLGDISGDVGVQNKEQRLEGSIGSDAAQKRANQGAQIRQAFMNRQGQYDQVAAQSPFDFDTPVDKSGELGFRGTVQLPNTKLNLPLDPYVDDIDSMIPTVSEAAKDPNNLSAKYLLKDMQNADTNPKIIVASVKGQKWNNQQIANKAYNSFNDYVEQKDPGGTVDISPTKDALHDMLVENVNSLANNPELKTTLGRYWDNFNNPDVDTSPSGVQEAISQMESEIEGMKDKGDRVGARALFKIKNSLNQNRTEYFKRTLSDEPQALAAIDHNDQFYRENVIPYVDPDDGLSKIMEGKDADKAVRPFFTDASPDEFARLFSHLDSKGQAAVRAEMIGRTEDAASRMKNFQSLNIPSIARYLENRGDQVATAFGNDQTIPGLTNLIRNTPRAGYQSNLAKSMSWVPSMGNIVRNSMATGLGGVVGGLPGMALGAGAEMGTEAGINKVMTNHLMTPNLADYVKAGKQ